MRWDPVVYTRYADERGRPFRDLITRIGAVEPRRVVDLGCGPGSLTTLLADRWPDAQIDGVDSSPEMIAQAQAIGSPVHFELGDIASWSPPADADVVVSNAALHWVDGHTELIRRWLAALGAGAWLAFQVPDNFAAPSHTIARELAESPRWSAKLHGLLLPHNAVSSPAEYATLLHDGGWTADAWETTYLHVFTGRDPILEWLRGTTLRPVLTALDQLDPTASDRHDFEAELATRLQVAYPSNDDRTLFEFRRVFVVGHKP